MNDAMLKNFQLIRTLITAVVSYAWLAYALTLMGVFYPWMLWILWLLTLAFLHQKKLLPLPHIDRATTLFVIATLAATLVITTTAEPTMYSGRDQGSISDAAIQFATHHSAFFHTPESDAFFDIYGRGKALNFPGFYYATDGALTTQFPLPYISFLAGFVGVFGSAGFIIANAALLFITLLTLTTIARHYTNTRYAWALFTLLVTAFPFVWFSKFTLSENLAAMLLWSSVFLYIFFKRDLTGQTAAAFFMCTMLLFFTRIEGVWLFMIFMILTLRHKPIRTWIFASSWRRFAEPLVFFIIVAIAALVTNIAFYHTLASTFIPDGPGPVSEPSRLAQFTDFLLPVYIQYNLFVPLLLAALFAAIAVLKKPLRPYLLPLAITAPLFLYYLDPHISSDHPWMLRRFMFALLPTTLLLSTVFLFYLHTKHKLHFVSLALFLVLLGANLFITAPIYSFANHRELNAQLHTFAERFSDSDLILLAPGVTGNGWAMIDAPLRTQTHKHAVYFFNPADYAKLDTSTFEHVYLVVPQGTTAPDYSDTVSRLLVPEHVTFTSTQLSTEKKAVTALPHTETITEHNLIYQLK
jgi:hypothetical protein